VPVGSYVTLTCHDECMDGSEEWSDENEEDHQAIWRVVSNLNDSACIEIPEKGRVTWARHDRIKVVNVADAFGSGAAIPVFADPVDENAPASIGGGS
jgi:hypothetical protein